MKEIDANKVAWSQISQEHYHTFKAALQNGVHKLNAYIYPYFSQEPDVEDTIGGYASERKTGFENYFWMHSLSSIINALTGAGLHLEYFHEFTENFFDSGEMEYDEARGLWRYPYNTNKFPISFSLKATVYPGRL